MIDQHNSLAEKFLKKGFWLYLFSFIIAPIGYIVKIIISGELTVSEVGILYGIMNLVGLLSAYNDLGMAESLNHFIPKFVTEKRYDKVKSILFYALFVQIITSLLIAGFFYFGSDYIAVNYFKTKAASETLKIFAFFFIGINILQTIGNFYNSIQDTFSLKSVDFIRTLCVMIFVLFIFFGDNSTLLNYSYSWLIGLYIGILFSITLFYTKYYKKYFKSEKIIIEKKLILKILKYASFVFIGASASTILGQIDMQMIIYLLGTTDAGYYTNYLSIISIPFMLIVPVFALIFPIVSEMHSKKETQKIKTLKNIFTKNFILIGIAFNILFFVFSEIIALILFGEKFGTSGIILKYSILFLIFNFLLQINFNLMAGIGKVKERVKIILVAVVFNFTMNYLLINSIGVSGAALATGFGWVLIWFLSELSIGKKYKINFDFKSIFKNIFFMGVMGIISYLYIINLFELKDAYRLTNLGYMFLVGIIWIAVFILINYKQFSIFIGEIKKLKGNKS